MTKLRLQSMFRIQYRPFRVYSRDELYTYVHMRVWCWPYLDIVYGLIVSATHHLTAMT